MHKMSSNFELGVFVGLIYHLTTSCIHKQIKIQLSRDLKPIKTLRPCILRNITTSVTREPERKLIYGWKHKDGCLSQLASLSIALKVTEMTVDDTCVSTQYLDVTRADRHFLP